MWQWKKSIQGGAPTTVGVQKFTGSLWETLKVQRDKILIVIVNTGQKIKLEFKKTENEGGHVETHN